MQIEDNTVRFSEMFKCYSDAGKAPKSFDVSVAPDGSVEVSNVVSDYDLAATFPTSKRLETLIGNYASKESLAYLSSEANFFGVMLTEVNTAKSYNETYIVFYRQGDGFEIKDKKAVYHYDLVQRVVFSPNASIINVESGTSSIIVDNKFNTKTISKVGISGGWMSGRVRLSTALLFYVSDEWFYVSGEDIVNGNPVSFSKTTILFSMAEEVKAETPAEPPTPPVSETATASTEVPTEESKLKTTPVSPEDSMAAALSVLYDDPPEPNPEVEKAIAKIVDYAARQRQLMLNGQKLDKDMAMSVCAVIDRSSEEDIENFIKVAERTIIDRRAAKAVALARAYGNDESGISPHFGTKMVIMQSAMILEQLYKHSETPPSVITNKTDELNALMKAL